MKYYFYKWRDDGTDQTVHDLPRWQVRESKRRLADPSLVVLDTQRLHAAAGVPVDTTGKDAAKKVPGRKRGIAVDVLGLVIAVVVVSASVHQNTVGDTAPTDRLHRTRPAPHMRGDEAARPFLERLEADERELTGEAEQVRARIGELGTAGPPSAGLTQPRPRTGHRFTYRPLRRPGKRVRGGPDRG